MRSEVVFHRLAAREAREAREAEAWYAARSSDTAERFRRAVAGAAERLAEGQGVHPVGTTRFRYVRVRRFPYRLIAHLQSTAAIVIAVTHDRRRPGYWRRRR